jgi:hypothetical protein
MLNYLVINESNKSFNLIFYNFYVVIIYGLNETTNENEIKTVKLICKYIY